MKVSSKVFPDINWGFWLVIPQLASFVLTFANKSEIRIIYDIYPYERVDINDFVNDVVDILNKNNINYEKRIIKFFSEYPSFEIYEGDKSIGIIILNYSIKI